MAETTAENVPEDTEIMQKVGPNSMQNLQISMEYGANMGPRARSWEKVPPRVQKVPKGRIFKFILEVVLGSRIKKQSRDSKKASRSENDKCLHPPQGCHGELIMPDFHIDHLQPAQTCQSQPCPCLLGNGPPTSKSGKSPLHLRCEIEHT